MQPNTPDRVRHRELLPKLLAVIACMIALGIAIVWLSIDYFALDYFSALLEKYDVPKRAEVMDMFLTSSHRGLLWASLASLVASLAAGYVLIKMILGPLYQMILVTRRVSAGDYTPRIQVSSKDEIGELGKAFNTMTDNLQRIEELRKRMVIDLAHELRAPLTNMRGYLEALSSGVLAATPQTIESLKEETLRLGNLTEDLMRLSVADSARLTLKKEGIDLQDIIVHSLKFYDAHFAQKSIAVKTQFPGASEKISADSEKLQQIVQNILDNAWRYTPRGGAVRISIGRFGGMLKVVVANTGEPLGAEHLSLIFERFYRIDRARSRELGGADIGLAIVKELVEAHGGRVGAESTEGENRIWFSLPEST